jgi:hypothetical protein
VTKLVNCGVPHFGRLALTCPRGGDLDPFPKGLVAEMCVGITRRGGIILM